MASNCSFCFRCTSFCSLRCAASLDVVSGGRAQSFLQPLHFGCELLDLLLIVLAMGCLILRSMKHISSV